MKQYMLLHIGFEKPTQEIMQAWGKWFESIKDIAVANGGFHGERLELTKDGRKDLPMGPDAITGYSIIQAENIEEAQKIAGGNPFISGIRVYEIITH
ncbi:MAG: YciI family protein [Gammaproteobacteria bacterium]|nr:YciI family protein [Gammaproteobacteria bacterium]